MYHQVPIRQARSPSQALFQEVSLQLLLHLLLPIILRAKDIQQRSHTQHRVNTNTQTQTQILGTLLRATNDKHILQVRKTNLPLKSPLTPQVLNRSFSKSHRAVLALKALVAKVVHMVYLYPAIFQWVVEWVQQLVVGHQPVHYLKHTEEHTNQSLRCHRLLPVLLD
jgi:hypothetical protein